MTSKVDFLGIGVQKAATTWLWSNLRRHPSIWLPPRKELHYFDRSSIYPSSNHLSSKYLGYRLIGRERHNKQFRHLLIRDLIKAIKTKTLENISWYLRYYLGTYDDNWYLSLFKYGNGKLKGEITPSYSMLNLVDVKHIKAILPELKIILILRNPIERAWSHVRFSFSQGRIKSIRDTDKIKQFIESRTQLLRSDYISMLHIWGSCFNKQKIYLGFYDDVVRNPQEMMFDIIKFLGIKRINGIYEKQKKVYVSPVVDIPPEIKYYLAKKYYPEIKILSNLIDGYPSVWLKETTKMLNFSKHI